MKDNVNRNTKIDYLGNGRYLSLRHVRIDSDLGIVPVSWTKNAHMSRLLESVLATA